MILYVMMERGCLSYIEGEPKMKGLGRMGGTAQGIGGECICPGCKQKTPHERGMPCYQINCPRCGIKMVRVG